VASSATASPPVTARPAAGIFFPQRPPLGLDSHAYSRSVLLKLVEAGGQLKSFALAARMARSLAEVTISGRHLGELTRQVGAELRADRDRRTDDYVHHRRQEPPGPAPQAVAVGVDGGRLQARVTTAGRGPGVHGHGWKEDKVACLHVLKGPTFAADPHPQPPRCFLDAPYVAQLVRDFQAAHGGLPSVEEVAAAAGEPAATPVRPGSAGHGPPPATGVTAAPLPGGVAAADTAAAAAVVMGAAAAVTDIPTSPTPPAAITDTPMSPTLAAATAGMAPAAAPLDLPVSPAPPAAAADPAWPPERLARTCVASLCDSATFAKVVAQEAYARHFFAAPRRAFLGDGQKYNWSIQQKWFKDFEPIADFIHPLSYVYVTAMAVAGGAAAGWPLYVRWLTACWQGRVAEVLHELRGWQGRLGAPAPGPGPPEDDVREVLRRTLGYLQNNASRMDYPRYRQQGLPVTTAHVESLIKEVNYRVKGTEKFWNDPEGAEAILQVRAAVLSDDGRLERHVQSRPASPYRYSRRRSEKRKTAQTT